VLLNDGEVMLKGISGGLLLPQEGSCMLTLMG
jgi:hypothetical protein